MATAKKSNKKKRLIPMNQGTIKIKNGVVDNATGKLIPMNQGTEIPDNAGGNIFDSVAAVGANLAAQAAGQPPPYSVNQTTGAVTANIQPVSEYGLTSTQKTVLIIFAVALGGLLAWQLFRTK